MYFQHDNFLYWSNGAELLFLKMLVCINIRVVRKLQFLNNFLIKIAILQGFSLKNCSTCEGTNWVPEQVNCCFPVTLLFDGGTMRCNIIIESMNINIILISIDKKYITIWITRYKKRNEL
jgi:hypothetical protein